MSRPLAPVILILVACFVLGFFARAQDQSTEKNSLKQGAWALQFGIRPNFTLTSFQGATIAAQYHLSEANAVRAGISIGGNIGDATGLNTQLNADTSTSSVSNGNSTNSTNVGLTVQYIWYMNPGEVVHFYVGVGPSLSYDHRHSEQQIGYNPGFPYSTASTSTSTNTTWAAGATGVAGIEWFPAAWFALHADYSEAINYAWSSATSEQRSSSSIPGSASYGSKSSGSNKGWGFSGQGVNFGLSVYF
jgi:hypothetical protein